MLMTCRCARLDFPDGSHGILIHAIETPARTMPLAERLQRLAEQQEQPVAAFAQAERHAQADLGFLHRRADGGLVIARVAGAFVRDADPSKPDRELVAVGRFEIGRAHV